MLRPSKQAERAPGKKRGKEPVETSEARNQPLGASTLPRVICVKWVMGAVWVPTDPMNKIQRIRYGLGDRRPVNFKIAPRVHFAGLGHHHEKSAVSIGD